MSKQWNNIQQKKKQHALGHRNSRTDRNAEHKNITKYLENMEMLHEQEFTWENIGIWELQLNFDSCHIVFLWNFDPRDRD